MRTSTPIRRRHAAVVSPPMPAPMMATLGLCWFIRVLHSMAASDPARHPPGWTPSRRPDQRAHLLCDDRLGSIERGRTTMQAGHHAMSQYDPPAPPGPDYELRSWPRAPALARPPTAPQTPLLPSQH